jgi:NAD(P)H-dependent FMN reductase
VPRLLVVHHTPSPSLQAMLEAVVAGAKDPALDGAVEVVVRPALSAGASDVLDADAVVVGTPANIGYMSGALKHFFDQIYYPVLDATVGRPFGVYVHGGSDTTGALRAIEQITGALRWRTVHEPVLLTGAVTTEGERACHDLGATVAANLLQARPSGPSRGR